jgi:hypothetical protein
VEAIMGWFVLAAGQTGAGAGYRRVAKLVPKWGLGAGFHMGATGGWTTWLFPAAPNGGAAVVVRPRQPVGSTDLQRFSSTEPVNGHTKDASNSWERIMKSFDSAASDAHLSAGSAVRKNEQVNLRDQFSLAEYNNLRMEILKMIELQSQLLNIIVVAFGAVVTVGLQTRNAAIIAIHPVLALILGICWLNHNYAIIRAADYIRSRLEPRFYENDCEGWEHYILDYKISHARIGRLGERAIFSGSSLVAVLAAVYVGATIFGALSPSSQPQFSR